MTLKGRQNFLEVICKNNIEIKVKLEKQLKKVVRNFWRWIDRKFFFYLWASKNLVGPGHPRPSARYWAV